MARGSKRISKLLDNKRRFMLTIPVGSTKAPPPDDSHLIQEAIDKGKVEIKVCPPATRGPDMRNRPRGH